MKKVTAYAPASIGNINLGFDVLGAALKPIDGTLLGDCVTVSESVEFELAVKGSFAAKLPADPELNIVTRCYKHFNHVAKTKGISPQSLAIMLDKNLPIGSGLGSSASSIVAALCALNTFYNSPFSDADLLHMMGVLEGEISGSVHYDNVAPCFLGGMTLISGLPDPIAISLPIIEQWYWVSCYSGISVSTAAARALLPDSLPLADTLTFGRQLAVFTDALYRKDASTAARVMCDVIAEPHRKTLLPGFDDARVFCMDNGALSFGISGSGPTVFAITPERESAEIIKSWLVDHYIQNEDGFCHVCKVDSDGTTTSSQT